MKYTWLVLLGPFLMASVSSAEEAKPASSKFKSEEAKKAEADCQAALKAATLKYGQDLVRAMSAAEQRSAEAKDELSREALRNESRLMSKELIRLHGELSDGSPAEIPRQFKTEEAKKAKAQYDAAVKAAKTKYATDLQIAQKIVLARKASARDEIVKDSFQQEADAIANEAIVAREGARLDIRGPVTFSVPANVPWTRTLTVKEGTVLHFVAKGTWSAGPNLKGIDADGTTRPKGRPVFYLRGRVGDKEYRVGKEAFLMMPQDGVLELGMYDDAVIDDNSEALSVTISVVAAPSFQDQANALVGQWRIRLGTGVHIWTFCPDRTITSSSGLTGVWTIDHRGVYIKWPSNWDLLYGPVVINRLSGDSWAGKGYWLATKIESPAKN